MRLAFLNTIRFKIWGGYAALGLVVTLVLLIIYFASIKTDSNVYQVVKESQPRAVVALKIATETERVLRLMTGYALSKDKFSKDENDRSLIHLRSLIEQYQGMLIEGRDTVEVDLVRTIVGQLDELESYQKDLFVYVSSDIENIPALKVAKTQLEPIGQEVGVQVADLMLLAEDFDEADEEFIQALYEFRYNWINALSSSRMFIALRNEVAIEQFDLYVSAVLQGERALEQFSQEADDEEVEEIVESIVGNIDAFIKSFSVAKSHHMSEKWRQDSYLVRTSILPLATKIDESLEKLLIVQEDNIAKATIALEMSQSRVRNSIITAAIVISVIFIVALLFSSYFVVNPIMHLLTYLEDISQGDADLHKRIEVLSDDELGQASSHFNDLMQSLEQMLIGVKGASEQVLTAARSSGENLDGLHGNCQKSAEHSDRVASVTESMLVSTKNIREQIDQSSQYVMGTEENIALGLKQMGGLSSQAKSMADEITQMQERIEQLSTKSVSMLGMVDIIKTIADQTNLLALNAAIEAARAGEAGRGFAVVADEVRTLATRTQQSTDDITHMLQENADTSEQFVGRIKQTVTKTDEMIESVKITEQAMRQISEEMVKVISVADSVDTSVDDQGKLAEQVFTACNKSNDVIRENLQAIEVIKSKVELMNNSSENLSKLLVHFKAGDE
ncbi:methyl-accepting chemotaxis protein [bacterium]|nr:methyl-accepting chemotaxis protein [bacterium]